VKRIIQKQFLINLLVGRLANSFLVFFGCVVEAVRHEDKNVWSIVVGCWALAKERTYVGSVIITNKQFSTLTDAPLY
jgi:hypothetical protein